MKLYETTYSALEGLKPVKINGKTYNDRTSKIISMGYPNGHLQIIYRKSTGEYWLYLMIPSTGHYITPLTDDYAIILIKQHEDSNRKSFAFPTSL